METRIDNVIRGFMFMGVGILISITIPTLPLSRMLFIILLIFPVGFFSLSLIYFIEAFREELKREKRGNKE